MSELRECPWCGSDAEIVQIGNEATCKRGFEVRCTKWDCATKKRAMVIRWPLEEARTFAVARWNTRTPSTREKLLVEALEFYADPEAWNQPPVKTIAHELFGPAYENQASKVRLDRGKIARAALSQTAPERAA